MSVFLLPKALYNDLEAIMSRYWWQKSENKKRIHWCTWANLSRPKEDDGLGFRDLAKLLKVKYYASPNILSSNMRSQPSLIWRSLWSAKSLLNLGLRWKVGT
ncbi:hypothetical protein like AT4G29090 [Hibiscus trionum]|uniref:Reverse transcriptase zinc-binding domain-containing protein n=1 Tax=Hibiscus trionum TaxID=183268 RepID=A0A9W7I137_HIBTR|nr:hypothetical protein like AT4G29090 [Hibiscus trionum]